MKILIECEINENLIDNFDIMNYISNKFNNFDEIKLKDIYVQSKKLSIIDNKTDEQMICESL